jgi:hypothetical protein
MIQTQFVYFGGSFWDKTADFWRKTVKLLPVTGADPGIFQEGGPNLPKKKFHPSLDLSLSTTRSERLKKNRFPKFSKS